MSNIDWAFIHELEGTRLKGYVPDPDGSESGVTIASGFDLGARNLSDLAGLPQDIIELLTPYLGIKGAQAEEIAGDLKVSDEQAKIIDEFSKEDAVNKLRSKWQAATGESFDDLPMNQATVVASVAFQYGDLASKTPNFWRQVTSGDWDGAVKNLNNFKDKYPTRRKKEADYFQKKRLEDTLAVTAPADSPLREMTNEELVAQAQQKIAAARGEEIPTTVEPALPAEERRETVSPYSNIEVPNWFMGKQPTTDYPIEPDQIVPSVGVQPSIVPEQTYDPDAKPMDPMDMIRRDISEAGPIAKTLSENDFQGANPLYFNEYSGQIWSAAFN